MRTTILRFNGIERSIHWAHAVTFLLLVFTGLALYFPSLRSLTYGGLKLMREAHLTVAFLFVAAPVIAASWDNASSVRRGLRDAFSWNRDDSRWLAASLLPVRRRRRPKPEQGRFNAGQKVNVFLSLFACAGLTITGLVIWPQHFFPTPLREAIFLVHDLLFWLIMPLVIGHIFLSLAYPTTREALNGMLSGFVDASWAAKRHGKWVGK